MESNKLRVLRIDGTYPTEAAPGLGQHAYYHAYYSNYDEMIIISEKKSPIRQNREGVRVIQVPQESVALGKYNDGIIKRVHCFCKKLKSQYDYFRHYKKYIDEFKPQIVQIYSPIPIIGGMYARKKWGAKLVMCFHGSDALRIGKNRLFKFILDIPDALVAVWDETGKMLNSKKNRPVICIGNGVDIGVFQNTHRKRENQFVHVASLRWQKGQEYLIEGFAKFHNKHNEYKLVLIGEGEDQEKLTELCKEKGIVDCVEFKGMQSREVIVEELNKSKAFVLTSVSEGFPKVIIESMATATPVISSDVGSVKKIVADSGIIFEPKNSNAVYEAMEKIVSSEEAWLDYSMKAENYSKQYSWEQVSEKLDDVYRDLLAGRSEKYNC